MAVHHFTTHRPPWCPDCSFENELRPPLDVVWSEERDRWEALGPWPGSLGPAILRSSAERGEVERFVEWADRTPYLEVMLGEPADPVIHGAS